MNVLILVDNIRRARFFDRLVGALETAALDESVNVAFVTGKFTCYVYLKRKYRTQVHLIRGSLLKMNKCSSRHYKEALEYLRGDVGEAYARYIFCRAQTAAKKMSQTYDCLLLWNGNQLIEKAFSIEFKKSLKKTIYLELGNFPGKIFADPEGVNASSRLASCPHILDADEYRVTDEEFSNWIMAYTDKNRRKIKVPQASDATKIPHERLLDYVLSRFGFGLYAIGLKKSINKTLNKLRCMRYVGRNFDTCTEVPPNYVFFPLQVSTDTQLLINSDIENMAAIKRAKFLAENLNLPLVLKFHPAEDSVEFYKRLKASGMCDSVIISNRDVLTMVESSDLVVTINSTVGLEALIMDKKLEVLGKSHYEFFIGRRHYLKRYICRYLMNIEYFNEDNEIGEGSAGFWTSLVLS